MKTLTEGRNHGIVSSRADSCFFPFPYQITHLITTEDDVRASSYKVSKANDHGAKLVTEKWLHECIKQKKRVSEAPYELSKDGVTEVRFAFLVVCSEQVVLSVQAKLSFHVKLPFCSVSDGALSVL